MSTYYTECVYLNCTGLSTDKTGLWPFRKKSPMDLCRDDCKEAGDNERRETKYEEDFHNIGYLDADIDFDGNVSAGYYQGMAPDDYSTEYSQFSLGGTSGSPQGDPRLLYAIIALAGGLIYLGMQNA